MLNNSIRMGFQPSFRNKGKNNILICKKNCENCEKSFQAIRPGQSRSIRQSFVTHSTTIVHRSFVQLVRSSFVQLVQPVRMGGSIPRTPASRACVRVYACVTPWAWIISPNNHNKTQSYTHIKKLKKICRLKNYPYICR